MADQLQEKLRATEFVWRVADKALERFSDADLTNMMAALTVSAKTQAPPPAEHMPTIYLLAASALGEMRMRRVLSKAKESN